VVGEPDIDEVLFHEQTGLVAELFVEHRAAVAGNASRPTSPCGGEEEPGSAPLSDRQGTVLPGQDPVPGRVSCDHGSQEGRHRPEDGFVVDEQVQVVLGVGLGGLLGERVPEELPVDRDLLEFGGLELEHPVHADRVLG
jgi:hypothetical protein